MAVWGNNGFGETNVPSALSNLVSVSGSAAPYHMLDVVNDGRPLLLRPPVGLTANVGRDVVLRGEATGTSPLKYQWLLNGTGLVLMILGVLKPDDGVSSWGFLLCLWMWIADVLVHHYPHGGSGKQDNPRPRPDDPTPTGDTADAWLKELSRQPTYR